MSRFRAVQETETHADPLALHPTMSTILLRVYPFIFALPLAGCESTGVPLIPYKSKKISSWSVNPSSVNPRLPFTADLPSRLADLFQPQHRRWSTPSQTLLGLFRGFYQLFRPRCGLGRCLLQCHGLTRRVSHHCVRGRRSRVLTFCLLLLVLCRCRLAATGWVLAG